MHHSARLRRPKRLREITRKHAPSWRSYIRSREASACHPRALLPMHKTVLRCAVWCKTWTMARENGHTGLRRAGISRPGCETCGARQRDALQRIRRKDATRALSYCRALGWLLAVSAGLTACAAWQGTTRDDRKRWQGCIVSSSPCACAPMRQRAFNGHHLL